MVIPNATQKLRSSIQLMIECVFLSIKKSELIKKYQENKYSCY